MKTRIIAELGSCHMGRYDRIKEAIDICKDMGIYALKLQLFPNEAPYVPTNIYLERELFNKAWRYGRKVGLPVTASVFDHKSLGFLMGHQPEFIKFSYGKKDQAEWIKQTLELGIETIVSCDVMTDHLVDKRATKLYCIPEYPVRYEVNFDELFESRFDGFSDHTMGIKQTQRAIDAGARIIEKHVRLGYIDETCPDAFFAVNIRELGKLKT